MSKSSIFKLNRLSSFKFSRFILFFLINSFCFSSCNQNRNEKKWDEKINKTEVTKKSTLHKKQSSQELNIDIQPYHGLSSDLTFYIYNKLRKLHPRVKLLPDIQLPERAYYKPRNRYRADTLIFLQRKAAMPNHVIIGLTNKDISTDKDSIYDWGVMGLGYQPGQACIISTHRLSKNNLKEQFFKVVIHELGHTQGLDHCIRQTCLMADAKGKNNLNNEDSFCEKCKQHLILRGFNL
jgi:archaemetzincin